MFIYTPYLLSTSPTASEWSHLFGVHKNKKLTKHFAKDVHFCSKSGSLLWLVVDAYRQTTRVVCRAREAVGKTLCWDGAFRRNTQKQPFTTALSPHLSTKPFVLLWSLLHDPAEGAVSDAGVPTLRGRDPNRKGLLLHQAGNQGAPCVCVSPGMVLMLVLVAVGC